MRTAGIVTASVGGAALIAGVVLNFKVNSLVHDMENTPGGYSPSRESDRKNYQTLSWAGYSVGGVCLGSGIMLYALGRRAGARASAPVAKVGLIPSFAPGQAGVLVTGAF